MFRHKNHSVRFRKTSWFRLKYPNFVSCKRDKICLFARKPSANCPSNSLNNASFLSIKSAAKCPDTSLKNQNIWHQKISWILTDTLLSKYRLCHQTPVLNRCSAARQSAYTRKTNYAIWCTTDASTAYVLFWSPADVCDTNVSPKVSRSDFISH